MSRVVLPSLASSSSKQAASKREMDQNQNSVVVLGILVKFWWMIPMGVRDNHGKFGQETQPWRVGTGVAGGRPRFQNLSKIAKKIPLGGGGGRLDAKDVHGGIHLHWNQPR